LNEPHTAVVILAAGASTRMGRTKALLPLGGQTMVEQAIASFRESGLTEIVVVVGHHCDELLPVLQRAGVRIAANPNPQRGMFTSVQTGVRALASGTTAFFLLPVDIPLVRSWTLRYLQSWSTPDLQAVVYPCFQDRRGHPPLIPVRLVPRILAEHNPHGGLRGMLADRVSIDVEVPDRNILFDVDAPEDLPELHARWQRRRVPDPDECEVILTRIHPVSAAVRAHSRKVASVAANLARALTRSGVGLNADLLCAAALLHDLAKGRKQHAEEARRILQQMGYADTAAVAGSHMDPSLPPEGGVDESAVLYLADKMVAGDRLVTLEERFRPALQRFGTDSAAARRIRRRWQTAVEIAQRIERLSGTSPASILAESEPETADRAECR